MGGIRIGYASTLQLLLTRSLRFSLEGTLSSGMAYSVPELRIICMVQLDSYVGQFGYGLLLCIFLSELLS